MIISVYRSAMLLGIILLTNLVITGCTTVHPFPDKARSGDTIILAIGSADGMNRSNMTISYIPDNDITNPIDLTSNIRSITKIYPDKTSYEWLFDELYVGNVTYYSSHGPWESIVIIDLPFSIPTGTGKIQITTGEDVTFAIGGNPNTTPISMEILPGTGAPNPFRYLLNNVVVDGDLSSIEQLPQIIVRQPLQGQGWPYGSPTYGSIKVQLSAPMQTNSGDAVPDADVRVVVDDMGQANHISQLQYSWVRDGDNITVYFMSPNGLMRYYESRFSVVIKPGNEFIKNPGPSLTSITYYDIDGYEIAGPVPTLSLE